MADFLEIIGDNAINLYKQAGFYEIEPYRFNPIEDTKYFEIDLDEN